MSKTLQVSSRTKKLQIKSLECQFYWYGIVFSYWLFWANTTEYSHHWLPVGSMNTLSLLLLRIIIPWLCRSHHYHCALLQKVQTNVLDKINSMKNKNASTKYSSSLLILCCAARLVVGRERDLSAISFIPTKFILSRHCSWLWSFSSPN